jgi:peptide/nickel transport system permease protein
MFAYLRYLAGRALLWAATIIVAVTVVFVVPRVTPGDPLSAVFSRLAAAGGSLNAPQLIAQYRKLFGLDRSMGEQYVSFLRELARGNLGYSISNFPSNVLDIVIPSLPWTIGLLTLTTIFSWILGSLIGAIVGWRGGKSRFFQALVPVALVLYTTPYYILALILIFLFAFQWRFFPLSGAYSVGLRPTLSLEFALDVLHHAAEVIFAYPGLGWVIYNAIKSLDFPVIQGSVLLLIVAVSTANFVIDLAYPLIDPRIRQAGRE